MHIHRRFQLNLDNYYYESKFEEERSMMIPHKHDGFVASDLNPNSHCIDGLLRKKVLLSRSDSLNEVTHSCKAVRVRQEMCSRYVVRFQHFGVVIHCALWLVSF